ncbi:unnamed protein product [Staurois parvus]|uniref:Reverse transcriptase domain-containing protein n=1 Tax=Staurois parvus TaxID=386267 RepID=A0ABN9GUJ9_9NEOB|nr:unnamed protein product [Staurois parvus]
MAQWEEDTIFKNHKQELIAYYRYIDDIILVWKGNETSLGQNCTHDIDYQEQSDILIKRFINKGYKKEYIVEERDRVGVLDRRILLTKSQNNNSMDNVMIIIMPYNKQYKDVQRIINKHWDILKLDKDLKDSIPENPRFIYKKAPNIRDKIVKNVLNPPKQNSLTFFSGNWIL